MFGTFLYRRGEGKLHILRSGMIRRKRSSAELLERFGTLETRNVGNENALRLLDLYFTCIVDYGRFCRILEDRYPQRVDTRSRHGVPGGRWVSGSPNDE